MIRAGTAAWFAQHETRLAWRDWAWLLSGGRRRRGYAVAMGLLGFVVFMHGLAYLTLARSMDFASPPDKRLLITVGGTLLLYWSLMLSQAMEAVTRAFYARGDLDLILSSPASAGRLFAVRIGAMAVSVAAMTLALAAPAINVLAWLGGARWLAAYGVVMALAMAAVAISVMLTIVLFRVIGPKRTRLAAQIVAAAVGASFVIGVQFVAILSVGTLSRIVLFQSAVVVDHAPDIDSFWWLPADAAMGDWPALIVVVALGAIALAAAIRFCAPRFGELALAAGGVSHSPASPRRRATTFRPQSPGQALRRKEWVLLWRDPWLMSQSLMQLLYLLPPFFLLSRSFYGGGHGVALLVPVLIMAAGQLAGGLAWLAISGEDAPDLIASAPVTAARVWRAKAEAVAGAIGMVFGPLVILLAIAEPILAVATLLGIAIAGASATLIQFWFRAQVKRSLFRRRHVSSRIATFAEALSSIIWAGAGALAVIDFRFAVVPGAIALSILAGAWMLSPRRQA
jgi:ABC-2 type transport system permease protein